MVSTNFNLSTLALVLIVFTVFTVALTENLQLADGLAAGQGKMVFELDTGESAIQTWYVFNNEDHPITLHFRAEGQGSEYLVFEKVMDFEPMESKKIEVLAVIPEDHKDNVEYKIDFYALFKGERNNEGGAEIVMNMEMITHPKILIGDNPIYTAPIIIEEVIEEVKPKSTIPEEEQTMEVAPVSETMQEKLDRIKSTNLANQLDKPVIVTDDIWDKDSPSVGEWTGEEAVPELQVDDNYLEEPTADLITQDKVECGFIDWLLSLFGMAKC